MCFLLYRINKIPLKLASILSEGISFESLVGARHFIKKKIFSQTFLSHRASFAIGAALRLSQSKFLSKKPGSDRKEDYQKSSRKKRAACIRSAGNREP